MQKSVIRHILTLVAEGGLSTDKALDQLSFETAQDALHGLNLGPATRTAQRAGRSYLRPGQERRNPAGRRGWPFPPRPVLVSRVSREQAGLLRNMFPAGLHWPEAGLFSLGGPEQLKQQMTPPWPQSGAALVVSAGAADMAVALEAFGALAFWGCDCGCVTDVGVAGLHRLSPHLRALHEARVIIAVAGMEGALPACWRALLPLRYWPCPLRWATAWARTASRRSPPCSALVCPAWPCSISTTASARRPLRPRCWEENKKTPPQGTLIFC